MQPISILHIARFLGVAGAETHLLSLLPGLHQLGHSVGLLVLTSPQSPIGDYLQAQETQGVVVQRLELRSALDPVGFWRMYRAIRAAAPDIVHTHLSYADLMGALAARLAGVPIVVSTRHGYNRYPPEFLYRLVNRVSTLFQDAVIAISQALRDFLTRIGVPDRKLHTVYYGLSPEPSASSADGGFPAIGDGLTPPVIGTVGRLDPIKGHPYLLEAFAEVRQELSTATLLIIGDGPLREALMKQARDLGIASKVVFAGYRRDVMACIAGMDVFALPSLLEGFGLVLLEAMAQHKPVVATDASAIREIVVDGETGVLVPRADATKLAEALLQVLHDPAVASQMGEAGYRRLLDRFSVQAMIAKTQAIYAQLITSRTS